MSPFPRDPRIDSTAAFLREGYLFITHGCQKTRSDVFQTRLMLKNVICMQGKEASQIFYDAERFTRKGAVPPATVRLLQGKGSVQLLDGEAHHARKQMFMSLMSPPSIQRLLSISLEEWKWGLARWELTPRITLHTELEELFCRAAIRWAGIPLNEDEIRPRARDFGAMIEQAAGIGPGMWAALAGRKRTERWAERLVREVRTRDIEPPAGSALRIIADHREPNGLQLSPATAAVELINILRPTVAVARFVTFGVHALHFYPKCREKLMIDEHYAHLFAQEVRRHYPFFPTVGGRALKAFEWRGHRFRPGQWVLFDIYGTNHDPRIWTDPERFRPERFGDWNESPFDFVPQGGGDFVTGHRCAGEWATIELIKTSARFLAQEMRYSVPEQDLSIDLSRIPALPKSRIVLTDVHSPSRRRMVLATA